MVDIGLMWADEWNYKRTHDGQRVLKLTATCATGRTERKYSSSIRNAGTSRSVSHNH
jgi:hypothetical protein